MRPQLTRTLYRDSLVRIAPQHQRRQGHRLTQQLAQFRHVRMPRPQQPQQMRNRPRSAQIIAIRLQPRRRVPALRSCHPPQADHLHPLRIPRHRVRHQPPRQRKIEPDHRIAFLKVRMRRRQQHQRPHLLWTSPPDTQRNRRAMRMPHQTWPFQLKFIQNPQHNVRRRAHRRIQPIAPLRLPRTRKINRNYMHAVRQRFQHRPKRLRTSHQSMQQHKRLLTRHGRSFFKKRNAEAVEQKMTALQHRGKAREDEITERSMGQWRLQP